MRNIENYTYLYALNWARRRYPEASEQRHKAFANCVTFALLRRPFSPGPYSLREHVTLFEIADSQISSHVLPGIEIYDRLAPSIFGPLQEAHYRLWGRLCGTTAGDDPTDLEALNTWLANLQAQEEQSSGSH